MRREAESSRKEATISSDNKQASLGSIARLYTQGLQEHGTSSKSVGWRDPQSHRLRLEKLAELFDGAAPDPVTVADLGCGYGAFFEFLLETAVPLRSFTGYDISTEMLNKAQERISSERARFVQAPEIREPVDYSVVCGTYNVRLERSEDDWKSYILNSLDNLNAFSGRGFAFNLLSTYVDYKEDHLYYGDPLFFFDHCKKRYSKQVALLHDYPLYEWTIIVRK